jgi:hypothetical protein
MKGCKNSTKTEVAILVWDKIYTSGWEILPEVLNIFIKLKRSSYQEYITVLIVYLLTELH